MSRSFGFGGLTFDMRGDRRQGPAKRKIDKQVLPGHALGDLSMEGLGLSAQVIHAHGTEARPFPIAQILEWCLICWMLAPV